MMIKIHTILGIKKIIGKREIRLSVPTGYTIEKLLFSMVQTWGKELSDQLFKTETARLLPQIRILVNGQDIGFLKGMETILNDGDEVHILPPVAGG